MPFYEYQCNSCGHTLEAMQKVSDAPLKKCPECGKAQLEAPDVGAGVSPEGRRAGTRPISSPTNDAKRNLADRPESGRAQGGQEGASRGGSQGRRRATSRGQGGQDRRQARGEDAGQPREEPGQAQALAAPQGRAPRTARPADAKTLLRKPARPAKPAKPARRR